MTAAIYPKYKKALINGSSNVDLSGGNVKMILVDEGAYTYDVAHDFLDDLASGARIAVSGNLTGKTFSDSADFDFDDPIWSAVTGTTVEAVALFIDTGVEATSRLVAYQNTNLTGAPVTPDGSNIKLVVHASGFFRL